MRYVLIEPEVPGGLGPGTVIDRSKQPYRIKRLHVELEDWLGSHLLECHPCFLVTESAYNALRAAGLRGALFNDVEISVSPEFPDQKLAARLPRFFWADIVGEAGKDDFGLAADGRLVVSETALRVFEKLGLTQPIVTPYAPDPSP